jgi:hypothetical protein
MLKNRFLHRPFWPLFFVLISILGWFILPVGRAAQAHPGRNIVLLYFTATGQNNAVLLQWATATELNTAGFLLERALSADGNYATLNNIPFIVAEGSAIMGAEYEATDDTAVNGTTYWYRLIEVELDGDENREGPVSATPGTGQATATFTPTPTSSPTLSPTQSGGSVNTPDPGGSQGPTATNQPTQVSPTQPPTAQPANTATPQPNPPTATPQPVSTVASSPTSAANQQGNPSPGNPPPTSSTNAATNSQTAATETNPQAISQVEPTATPDGYPGQPEPTATTSTGEPTAYPGPIVPGDTPQATAYPGGQPSNETNSPAVIGGDAPTPTQAANTAEQPADSGGNVLLWVAFVVALLVFIGGVFGSIYLFNRQRVRGS